MKLNGKVALVTGSTSGIGLGIARALAAEGAKIMLRAELGARYHAADMAKPAEVRRLVEETVAQLGSVDILVNNAGIQHVAPVEDIPDERWDAVIAINLSASFHAIKAALSHMRTRGWGRIVNIASAHGLVASANSRPRRGGSPAMRSAPAGC